MRGNVFHNRIVKDACKVFKSHGWQVFTEYRYQCGGVVTYFDLFARKDCFEIACEVETTLRHLEDNAIKAQTAEVELWIIVPTRRLLKQAKERLSLQAWVILPDQLSSELQERRAS